MALTELKAIEGARKQHAGLFMRMATGGQWDLYEWEGALSGVAIFERGESPSYPPLVSNVHAMTAETLATKLMLTLRAAQ